MRFDYYEPSSIAQTMDFLKQDNGRYKLLAGGTDLIIHLRRNVVNYEALVNVKLLPNIATWSEKPGEGFRFGAATSLRAIETAEVVRDRLPSLVEAIEVIGSVPLRNSATIGGNLCNASPSADCAPALMVAGATASYVDDNAGNVTVPVQDFSKDQVAQSWGRPAFF